MSQSTLDGDWLTVSQVAAVLGVSERAIQKRCHTGKLKARRITTPQGTRWEIDARELPNSGTRTTEPNEPVGRERTPESPNEGRELGSDAVQNEPNQRTELSAPDANERTERANREAEYKAEIQFLRGVVEAQNRDAAELRAALRAALAMSNRALPEPGQSTFESPPQSRHDEARDAELAPMIQEAPEPIAGPQIEPQREEPASKYFERSRGFRAWLLKLLRG